MNSLTRTLAKIATSEAQQASRRWILQSFSTSTTSKRLTQPENPSDSKHSAPKEWPRPGEIPYQSKVANSVSLSGYIHMPVQFEAASDGKFWAGTVIAQNPSSDSPPLWYLSPHFLVFALVLMNYSDTPFFSKFFLLIVNTINSFISASILL